MTTIHAWSVSSRNSTAVFFIWQFKVSIFVFHGGLEKESGKTAVGSSHIVVFFV